ncbi:glycoside hydrolase family 3 protein [Phyllobacterium leguminum]|uniref:beta-N-acetylhexosaminidase n=1 Tax=Phyllobacterium leguminum TaxID=314237 RepID=A0A318TES0_9HYPH|nr:glycoside hydrolase family 3 protein [Phyllobacterium leguminum]PYE90013.1 beta-N-acetylhexosaminidase [Phyllobacterium leguminum]
MTTTDEIKRMVASMTIEEKIGQKIILDFMHWNGADMTAPSDDVKSLLVDNNIGGVILFSNNLKDTAQIKTLTSWFASIQTKPGTRLFLATDEEGGDVFRLPRGDYPSYPGNMALGAAVYGGASPSLAYSQGKQMAQDLKALNINVAFAPVADVNTNAHNPVINVRSFGANWSNVQDLAEQLAAGIRSEKVMTTYKHFPGHGGAWSDSHLTLPLITRDRSDAFTIDIAPYKAAIDKGMAPDIVLTAHIQYPSLDNTKVKASKTGEMIIVPATMSREIQTVILRNQLGFKGVTVSDALSMGAITNYFTEEDAIAKVFAAGVDISLMPIGIYSKADMALLPKFIKTVVDKVKSGVLNAAEIDASVERILRLKSAFGLASGSVSSGQAEAGGVKADPFALEKEIADKSVTLLRNNTGELPVRNTQKKFFIFTPWGEQGEGIAQALTANGYKATSAKQGAISEDQRNAYIDACDVFVMGTMSAGLDPNDPEIGPARTLMLHAQNDLKKTVVHVSLRAPYDVIWYDGVRNCVATYARYGYENGRWRGPSMKTLGEVLIGKRNPVGKLPTPLYWSYDDNVNLGVVARPYYMGYGLSYNTALET